MPNLGLLGALGGLGKGIADTGNDILRRRERALEEARRDAEYQRRLADSRQDTASKQEFEIGVRTATEDRRDARTTAQLAARAAENKATRDFRSGEAEKKFGRDKELVTLRDKLKRDTDKATAKFRADLEEKLSANDVRSIEYGQPNANGYAEVIAVHKDGSLHPTGQRVYKPKLDYEDDEEEDDEDTL